MLKDERKFCGFMRFLAILREVFGLREVEDYSQAYERTLRGFTGFYYFCGFLMGFLVQISSQLSNLLYFNHSFDSIRPYLILHISFYKEKIIFKGFIEEIDACETLGSNHIHKSHLNQYACVFVCVRATSYYDPQQA